jgi:spermidine synthase
MRAKWRGRPPASVAVCGLGAGALAAYARPGQHWTFYELDPAVVRVALDPALFTYLRDHFPDPAARDIVTGDARQRLRAAPDGAYDLIVLDAFSSDAIPVHLLTREAAALYLRKLAPDGVLAFHVSNRYLDLVPVLAALARDAGLGGCRVSEDLAVTPDVVASGWEPSVWVALGRRPADLGAIGNGILWGHAAAPERPAWTDDFSNVWGAFRAGEPR